MDGASEPIPFEVTRFNEIEGVWSPDGKYIAYRSDESGRFELYVKSFPEGTGKYRVSTSGAGDYGEGFVVGWRGDGKELIYANAQKVMAVAVQTEPEFSAGAPRVLFDLSGTKGVNITFGNDMTSDAQRFLIIVGSDTGSALSIVLNWQEILNK